MPVMMLWPHSLQSVPCRMRMAAFFGTELNRRWTDTDDFISITENIRRIEWHGFSKMAKYRKVFSFAIPVMSDCV
jgi:hypothetical protein